MPTQNKRENDMRDIKLGDVTISAILETERVGKTP